MKNRYRIDEAEKTKAEFPDAPPLAAERVYTTRLLGMEPELALHGGGNTSVKTEMIDLTGRPVEVLLVKASGLPLDAAHPGGFVALDLASLRRLADLDDLSDEDMESELQLRRVRVSTLNPSVETLVHAFLPHRFIDHTHADAVLALTNQPDGARTIAEVFGPETAVVRYARPGFPLAARMLAAYRENPSATSMIVLNHGLFTFGGAAEEAYGRMIDLVDRAEAYIAGKGGPGPKAPEPAVTAHDAARLVQTVRGACAHPVPAGQIRRMHAVIDSRPEALAAAASENARQYCEGGVPTPDHVTRVKNRAVFLDRIPADDAELKEMVESALEAYLKDYGAYFEKYAAGMDPKPEMSDSHPRIFLVKGLGLIALGLTRRAATGAADIAAAMLRIKMTADRIGCYEPVDEQHVFDLEYWPLQQKKAASASAPLDGKVALVTGAAGAIGFGVADRLLAAGAAVVMADIDADRVDNVAEKLAGRYGAERVGRSVFDVTDYDSTARAFDEISQTFGGLDVLVPNAGVAHVATLEDLDPDKLDQVLAVNLKGVFHVIKAAAPIFRRQGVGGHIVIISSKNVSDPGASFGAYSASKAGAHQLGKIAALELAEIGVRVNMINPDAVFGCEDVSSGLWDLVGPDRMRSRGLDPSCMIDYYCQRNLLKCRVGADHVGNAVVFFAADLTPTTGATLPVDGGVSGAFPR